MSMAQDSKTVTGRSSGVGTLGQILVNTNLLKHVQSSPLARNELIGHFKAAWGRGSAFIATAAVSGISWSCFYYSFIHSLQTFGAEGSARF